MGLGRRLVPDDDISVAVAAVAATLLLPAVEALFVVAACLAHPSRSRGLARGLAVA